MKYSERTTFRGITLKKYPKYERGLPSGLPNNNGIDSQYIK